MTRSRWLTIGLAAATVVALYVLAAMLLGPPIAERELRRYLAEPAGLDVAIERVRIDPFTLLAEFRNLALSRPGEPPLLVSDSVFVRFSLAGLWRPGLDLNRLDLARPRVSLNRFPADARGLSRWLAGRAAERPLRIRQLGIQEGSLSLTVPGDRPRTLGFEQLTLTGTQLGSEPGARGKIHLQARHSLGGSLTIEAQTGLNPLAASGTFSVDVADLNVAGRWLDNGLAGADGRVMARGEFGLAAEGDPGLTLTGLSLQGTGIEFQNAAGDAAVRLDDARGIDVELDFRQRIARAGRIAIDGGALALGSAAWQQEARWLSATEWTVRADRIDTRGLDVEVAALGRAWRLSDVELELADFDSGAAKPADFTLATTLGPDAPLRARGRVAAAAPALEATLDVTGLDLGEIRPPLRLGPDLDLGAGRASAELTVSYGAGLARAEGRAELTDLTLVERTAGRRLLAAAGVTLEGIALDGAGASPSIARVRLREPRADLRLDAEGRLHPSNWSDLAAAAPVAIERLEIGGGALILADSRLAPPLEIQVTELTGAANGLGAGPGGSASLELTGRINETATGRLAVNWRLGGPRQRGRVELNLAGIEPPLLHAYASRFAGRGIESGTLDLGLRYLLDGSRFRGRQRLVLEDLRLGQPVEGVEGPPLPLDLAVALLADRDGRIDVTVPAAARLADGEFNLGIAIGQALSEYLSKLQAAPFAPLGELVGLANEDLGRVAFGPGSAALAAESERRLAALGEALARRPALGLTIAGGYAPEADRAALARQQVRLHIGLATAAGPSAATEAGPPAFSDAKVQSVLDEFAGERLDPAELAAINRRHVAGKGVSYYRELFEALVANEPIGEPALKKLARYRAQSIRGRLIELGLAADRLRLAEPTPAAADGNSVLVALGLELAGAMTPPLSAGRLRSPGKRRGG